MSDLKINLQEILQEKQDKIIPENIKKDVQIFDVIGTYEGSDITLQEKSVDITDNGTIEVVPDSDYYGLSKVNINTNVPTGIDTSDANATSNDIAIGKTAYVNGEKITGTLPLFPNTRTFTVSNAGVTNNTEDSTLDLTTINTTKQILDSNVSMNFNADYSDVATAIGLTADKIKAGETILGITGTYTGENDVSL